MNRSAIATAGSRLALGLLLALLVLALGLGGCRGKVDQSDLERFAAQYRDLPAAEYEDSLRAHLNDSTPVSVFAHYELGNLFYRTATDSAESPAGWNTDVVTVLLDSAQLHLEQAIAGDTTFVEAYVNLGSLWDDRSAQVSPGPDGHLERKERLEKAKELYLQALHYNPDDEKAGCNLGALHLKLKETNEALDRFRHVLVVNPNSALAHYNLAIMFAEEKMYNEAIVEWEAAAKADPGGDIGSRSLENIRIVKELMTTEIPENLGGDGHSGGH
jgi:tetratricopeptide (TPR) repeat protein